MVPKRNSHRRRRQTDLLARLEYPAYWNAWEDPVIAQY
jgi:hypothetical protein